MAQRACYLKLYVLMLLKVLSQHSLQHINDVTQVDSKSRNMYFEVNYNKFPEVWRTMLSSPPFPLDFPHQTYLCRPRRSVVHDQQARHHCPQDEGNHLHPPCPGSRSRYAFRGMSHPRECSGDAGEFVNDAVPHCWFLTKTPVHRWNKWHKNLYVWVGLLLHTSRRKLCQPMVLRTSLVGKYGVALTVFSPFSYLESNNFEITSILQTGRSTSWFLSPRKPILASIITRRLIIEFVSRFIWLYGAHGVPMRTSSFFQLILLVATC